ncbi:MAG: peptidase S41, partial [Symploca sp. SIO1B1]|nr:peptidase S41 [Symploca sp. SIO1B1]
LKDNQRATVIGTQTFGKAAVQSVHALSDGSGLAVTVSRYYPPSGIDITKKGITPDIKLGLTRSQKQLLQTKPELIATNKDPQYQRALKILEDEVVPQPILGQTNDSE